MNLSPVKCVGRVDFPPLGLEASPLRLLNMEHLVGLLTNMVSLQPKKSVLPRLLLTAWL